MSNSLIPIAGTDVKRHLNARWYNQQAIAHNIANANTPGFRARRVSVDESSMSAAALPMAAPSAGTPAREVASPMEGLTSTEGDALPLDLEMTEMAKNTVFYQTLLETVQRKSRLANAVVDGR